MLLLTTIPAITGAAVYVGITYGCGGQPTLQGMLTTAGWAGFAGGLAGGAAAGLRGAWSAPSKSPTKNYLDPNKMYSRYGSGGEVADAISNHGVMSLNPEGTYLTTFRTGSQDAAFVMNSLRDVPTYRMDFYPNAPYRLIPPGGISAADQYLVEAGIRIGWWWYKVVPLY